MAQFARISNLAEALMVSVTDLNHKRNPREYRKAKDFTVRSLRTQNYVRTNQFDVQARLEGLDEKFRVLNRDDLADALKARLKELGKTSDKWMPEILSLFLQLSDRPVEKTRVEDLELLKPPPSPPPLTWADIIAEDPLDEEGIWDDIDYAAESSEDERSYRTRQKSVAADDIEPTADIGQDETTLENCVVEVEPKVFDEVKNAQFWHGDVSHVDITELQAVRETLFMLRGLSTELYFIHEQTATIAPRKQFHLTHAISTTAYDLFEDFAELGSKIYSLRIWSREKQSVTLHQTLQASISRVIAEFDKHLASLQQRYLCPDEPLPVSCISVLEEVRRKAASVLRIAGLIDRARSVQSKTLFTEFEMLFDETNLAQLMGEEDVFGSLGKVFFDCLSTYLKPLKRWMESGELGLEDPVFFVGMSDQSTEASSLWHDRFVLRQDSSGRLHAPNFLHPEAKQIFNTGKSVVFLKELGEDPSRTAAAVPEPNLDFNTVCGGSTGLPLPPFSELFGHAFREWIGSKRNIAYNVLRERIFGECGLWNTLDCLEYIYLSKDGSVFQTFADSLFDRMDGKRRTWTDRFVLTELAQSTFGLIHQVHPKDLVVRTSKLKYDGGTLKNFSYIHIDYMVPWAVMNVVQRSSLTVYQQIFTFLLQIHRAKYLLQNVVLQDNLFENISTRHQTYSIRHRLIWFSDILRSYLSAVVIAETTEEMRKDLAIAEDIDSISAVHATYVSSLQTRSLLSKTLKPIHDAIVSALDLTVTFSEAQAQLDIQNGPRTTTSKHRRYNQQLSARSRSLASSDESASDEEDLTEDETDTEKPRRGRTYQETLTQIDEQFNQLHHFILAGLRSLGRTGGEPIWEILAERLDWNAKRTAL